jgi:asparagine synthase (glutamine-hydrolysing)
MCGLYASLGFKPDRARIDIVAHRGPDGSGWREFQSPAGAVALGHRRLAIIDLSDAGLQPMASRCGRFHLVFNGEIYNFVELREELRGKGHVFTSDSDSEVLLAAYVTWGEACLDHFLGMFAFLIWDEAEKRLFAARDRFGIKPLYYAVTTHGIAFGSEIKQLLGLPGVGRRANLARLNDFLVSGIADHTAETMFADVRQLRGGECVTVEAGRPWDGEARPRRWYDLMAVPAHSGMTEAQAAEGFRALLTDAVRMHLRSDVRVGSCLSGGLDSSTIVCLMAGLLNGSGERGDLHTVSACYAEKSVDEKPFMDVIVAATGATPHFIYPKAEDVFARASDITWHQDEPFGSTSIFAQWCVFEEARRSGIKVMLDGQGADEQLAGYHSSFPYYMANLMRRGRIAMALRTILERRRWHGLELAAQLRFFVTQHLNPRVARLVAPALAGRPARNPFGTELLRAAADPRGAFALAGAELGLAPVTDVASLCATLTYASNLQLLLHWEDRNSMAHGIEARVPFVDHRLVEFSLRLGNDHKIVGGDTKRVLRSAMKSVLPEKVRQRRDKLGFATPEEAWFRGPLRGTITDGIEATLRDFPGLLDPVETRALAADMLDGRRPVDFSLWRIAGLSLWKQRLGAHL